MAPAVALAIIGLAILIALVQLARGCHRKAVTKRATMRPFLCEQCNREFMAPWRGPTARCPECGQQTPILRHYFVCNQCGHRFLAYDFDAERKRRRSPGEDWRPAYPPPIPVCPKCKSTDTALERPYKQ